MRETSNRLAIIGGGPAGLMVFKRLVASNNRGDDLEVDIFESSEHLGSGMPYSVLGARNEHVTNVSADEIPDLVKDLDSWIMQLPAEVLSEFKIDRERFHEKKVVPRLLFGLYLKEQFESLIEHARTVGMRVNTHLSTRVLDLIDGGKANGLVTVRCKDNDFPGYDCVIISTGHQWKVDRELHVEGYFDSPYPPSKLSKVFNHTVVIRGSSLTAIDAIKTIANSNGVFHWDNDRYVFTRNETSPKFKIEMHSREGLLPSVRIHMDEPHVDSKSLIPAEKVAENMAQNDGFLQLDFLFEEGFKRPLAETDPDFYEQIRDMTLEEFVDEMMSYRERMPAFELLKKEYDESLKSIRREDSVAWKEMLASLSFAMNYPAKHLSAEDMLRLRKRLMPLISVVIAFIPQGSVETLLALHDADCLELITDGENGEVMVEKNGEIVYKLTDDKGHTTRSVCETFIDCIGQPHLNLDDFPFKSLVEEGTIYGAKLRFASGEKGGELLARSTDGVMCENGVHFLKVPGVAINDHFQPLDARGKPNNRIYIMAVPHIGGFNPDYSGLDFCEQASKIIVKKIFSTISDVASVTR